MNRKPSSKKRKTLEAALFIAGRELKTNEVCKLLRTTPEMVDSMIDELINEYSQRNMSITILKLGTGYKMDIDNADLVKVKRLASETEMSRGLLKCLSYIAYKQPVKQSEVVGVIGTRTYDYIKELKDKGFLQGKPAGRTRILTTTPKFAAYFGTNAELLKQGKEDMPAKIEEPDAMAKKEGVQTKLEEKNEG